MQQLGANLQELFLKVESLYVFFFFPSLVYACLQLCFSLLGRFSPNQKNTQSWSNISVFSLDTYFNPCLLPELVDIDMAEYISSTFVESSTHVLPPIAICP